MNKFILLLGLCTAAFLIPLSAAQPSPWDSWRTAYSCFEQGENFRDKGDYLQALKSFEEALASYQAVKKARPDWNQRVIAMRIERCRTECSKMRRLLGKNAPAVQEPGVPRPAPAEPVLPQTTGDSVELRNARTQLQQAALELRELRRKDEQSRKFETEIANLLRDLRIAKEEYALLQRRCKVLEDKVNNPSAGSEQFRNQLIEANMRYDRLKKQFDSVTLRMRSLEESSLNQSGLRNAAENAVIKLRDENNKLNRQIEELRQNIADSNQKIKLMQIDLKNSGKSSQQSSEKQELLLRDAMRKQSEAEQRLELEKNRSASLESKLSSTEQLLNHERSTAQVTLKELEQLRQVKNSLEADLARVSGDLKTAEQRLSVLNSSDFRSMTRAKRQLAELQKELEKSKKSAVRSKVTADDFRKQSESRKKELDKLKNDLRRVTAERNMLADQESKQRAKLVTLEGASAELDKMRKNFEALSAENRENRRIIEASKPREAEFSRIKLRLAELDRLNASLNREQRLNEELKSVNRRMEKELAATAEVRNQYYAAQKRLTELEPLKEEVERLKKMNTELAGSKKFEAENVALKTRIAQLEPLVKELEALKQLNIRMTDERNQIEKDMNRIRNMSAGTQLLDSELQVLRKRINELLKEKNLAEQRSLQLQTQVAALSNVANEANRQREANKALVAQLPSGSELEKMRAAHLKNAALEKSVSDLKTHSSELAEVNAKMRKELSHLRLVFAELRRQNTRLPDISGEAAAALKSENLKALELEISLLKKQLATLTEQEKAQAAIKAYDFSKLEKLLSYSEAADTDALKKRCIELEEALKASSKEMLALQKTADSAGQTKFSLEVLRKRNLELIDENTVLKGKVRNADAAYSELARSKAEIEGLRKLASQLEKAKKAEEELVKLKLKYAEFDQLKDEVARVNRLNRELYARRDKLEKELRERPRFGMAGTNVPVLKIKGNPDDFVSSGKIAEAEGNYELARWNYEQALKINDEHPDAMRRAAYLALRRKEFDRSSDLLSRMREKDTTNARLALDLAKSYTGEKRYGNALAILESMRSNRANDGEFLELISDAFVGSSRFDDAEQCLKMAIRLRKNDSALKIKLAKVITASSATRLTEAAALYEEARAAGAEPDIELEPKLGKMLDERRDFEKFLAEAAQEAERSNDWQSSQWYYRQLLELGRKRETYIPRLAFARYKCDDPAAMETLAFNSKTPLGNLVMMLIHLRNKDERQAIMAAKEAKYLNGGKIVVVPQDWHELAVELKLKVGAAGLGLRGVLGENFTTNL